MNQIAGCVRRLAALVLCACLLAAGLSGCSSAWNAPADSAAADGSPVSKEDLNYDASLGVIDTKKFEGTVLPKPRTPVPSMWPTPCFWGIPTPCAL